MTCECGAKSVVLPERMAVRRARYYASDPTVNGEPPVKCAACVAEVNKRRVSFEPEPGDEYDQFRAEATPEERKACPHPEEDCAPLSGRGWMCGLCGVDGAWV